MTEDSPVEYRAQVAANFCKELLRVFVGREIPDLLIRAEEAIGRQDNRLAIDLLNQARGQVGDLLVEGGFATDGSPLKVGMKYEDAIDVLGKAVFELERL